MKLKYPLGAIPLDPNDIEGLIPDYISTQDELNIVEKENIIQATTWAYKKKYKNILYMSFIHHLHKMMFGEVWQWAGTQRHSDKNIGVTWSQIPIQLNQLLNDVNHWIEKRTYSHDEIGTRFHHRLVEIHIYPNGNGRHARLMTDILLQSLGKEPFSWGLKESSDTLDVEGTLRKKYISALKEGDSKKFQRLIQFVRS